MFPSRGGGSCIPQVLFSNCWCMLPPCVTGTCIPHVLLSLAVHVYHHPRKFRLIHSVTLNSSRMQCNGIDYAWASEDGILQVLLAISGVCFHSVVVVHDYHRGFLLYPVRTLKKVWFLTPSSFLISCSAAG